METNWDEKYKQLKADFNDPPRPWLTAHPDVLPSGGWVLETAFGLGANIPYLATNGNHYIGIERSIEAIRYVKCRFPNVDLIRADLATYRLPEISYNLICNFYYFERSLYSQFLRRLLPGGVVVIETLTKKMLKWRPDMNPDRLLTPGFLLDFFRGWKILDYREGWFDSEHGHEKAIESIIARKLANS